MSPDQKKHGQQQSVETWLEHGLLPRVQFPQAPCSTVGARAEEEMLVAPAIADPLPPTYVRRGHAASRAFSAAHGLFSLSEAIHTGEGVVLEGVGNTGDPRTRLLYGHHKEVIRSKGDNDCEFGL
jgi:hypothetical protein